MAFGINMLDKMTKYVVIYRTVLDTAKHIQRKISMSLNYITEREARYTNDGKINGEYKEVLGSFYMRRRL